METATPTGSFLKAIFGFLVFVVVAISFFLLGRFVEMKEAGEEKREPYAKESYEYGKEETPSTVPDESEEAIEVSAERILQPVAMTLNEACFRHGADGQVVAGLLAGCADFGAAQIGGLRVRLLPVEKDISKVALSFFDGPAEWTSSPLTLSSLILENPEWFGVNILGVSGTWIFVEETSGHESMSRFHVYDGSGWSALDMWTPVEGFFPDTIQPPFSLRLLEAEEGEKGNRLLLTEENSCCGAAYNSSNPIREMYRMQYVLRMTGGTLEGPTFEVVEERKIPR